MSTESLKINFCAICGVPASNKCAVCTLIVYSKEYQKANWKKKH